jgi:hypothetical protein
VNQYGKTRIWTTIKKDKAMIKVTKHRQIKRSYRVSQVALEGKAVHL